MRIHMGANYEGYALGRELETWVKGLGHEVVWHGADAYDFEDDYPLFAFRIGQAVIADEDAALEVRGVLVGGVGGGVGRVVGPIRRTAHHAHRQHAGAGPSVLLRRPVAAGDVAARGLHRSCRAERDLLVSLDLTQPQVIHGGSSGLGWRATRSRPCGARGDPTRHRCTPTPRELPRDARRATVWPQSPAPRRGL